MRRGICSLGAALPAILLVAGAMLTAIVTLAEADGPRDEAIKKDRATIKGTWRVVALVVDGNASKPDDAKKLSVANGSDGTWSIRSEGKELEKGTSTIDPTKTPKTIDFTPTMGESKGKLHLGIYELGEKTRKLCFAGPDQARPKEFSSKKGSGTILVTFERIDAK